MIQVKSQPLQYLRENKNPWSVISSILLYLRKYRWNVIVRSSKALNRDVVDSDHDWRFGQPVQKSSSDSKWVVSRHLMELSLVIDRFGQLICDVISRLSSKPWCYWLWLKTLNVIGAFHGSIFGQSYKVGYLSLSLFVLLSSFEVSFIVSKLCTHRHSWRGWNVGASHWSFERDRSLG